MPAIVQTSHTDWRVAVSLGKKKAGFWLSFFISLSWISGVSERSMYSGSCSNSLENSVRASYLGTLDRFRPGTVIAISAYC